MTLFSGLFQLSLDGGAILFFNATKQSQFL